MQYVQDILGPNISIRLAYMTDVFLVYLSSSRQMWRKLSQHMVY